MTTSEVQTQRDELNKYSGITLSILYKNIFPSDYSERTKSEKIEIILKERFGREYTK